MLPKAPELGKALKSFRLEKEWSQQQMAAFLGVARSTLARIESGEEIGDINRHRFEKKIGKLLEATAA